MSDASGREWRFYIDDMIDFSQKVLVYTDRLNQDSFVESGLNYDATLRNIELIGEAATHIPSEIRTDHPEVPWRMIIATRNRVIHGFMDTWELITISYGVSSVMRFPCYFLC